MEHARTEVSEEKSQHCSQCWQILAVFLWQPDAGAAVLRRARCFQGNLTGARGRV